VDADLGSLVRSEVERMGGLQASGGTGMTPRYRSALRARLCRQPIPELRVFLFQLLDVAAQGAFQYTGCRPILVLSSNFKRMRQIAGQFEVMTDLIAGSINLFR
jgi:hypothetical protein